MANNKNASCRLLTKVLCLATNVMTLITNLRSFYYLFIYLKLPDERHSVTTLITPRSGLGPHCLLKLMVNAVSAN